MRKQALLLFLLTFTFGSYASTTETMASRFKNPINDDRPWVYWYWLNGNINAKGLIADLEAMHQAGIGTAMTFDIGIGVPGKITVRSKEWYDLMRVAILKADELGMRMGFNCPGWANAGGPWITPENSMKELIWNEVVVNSKKSKKDKIVIPASPSRMGFYKDIAVLAFPTTKNDEFSLTPNNCVFTDTAGNAIDGAKLLDNDRDTYERLPGTFEIVLNEPQEIQSFQVRASAHGDSRFFVMDLWAYDSDSQEFKLIENIHGTASGLNDRPGMGTASFAPVKSDRFRFGFKRGYGNTTTYSDDIYLQEINLHGGYRMPLWHNKIGFGHHEFRDRLLNPSVDNVVNSSDVIDVTHLLRSDGTLDWYPKSGTWTIVRLGYIPTGAMSQPLNRGLLSLECDKYSVAASKVQYDSMMMPLYRLVGNDVAKRVFSNYHVDSYEVGWQNWSECLPEEFCERRGYDLRKYLVSLTGRAVNSETETNAFLWDFRRTMADCYADNHIGYFTERANKDGIIFSIEAYDGPFEDLQTAGRTNMPMSEIWQGNDPNPRPRSAAMFAAHTYGHNLVGSEQYTGMGNWSLHPWKMKNLADASMAYGVNNFVMHVFTQQPWTDPKFTPGATLGPWGAHYDRANTWWKESRGWHEYISRCQYMLRQGQPVADILYYVGDNAPGGGGNVPVNPPAGFDGDAINQEILNRLVVNNGEYVLPNGKRYKYLVMPNHGEMTLKSLEKIDKLVSAGGTILGGRPIKSRTMADIDKQQIFEALASNLFDAGSRFKGRVFANKSIEEVIGIDKLTPDFKCNETSGLNLKYNHRKTENADIYFVSNISDTAKGDVVCAFRVDNGMEPKVWIPLTGEIHDVLSYKYENGVVSIPMYFCEGDTKFIVFTNGTTSRNCMISEVKRNEKTLPLYPTDDCNYYINRNENNITLSTRDNGIYDILLEDGSSRQIKIKQSGLVVDLSDNWKVMFESRLLSPMLEGKKINDNYVEVDFKKLHDWSENSLDGIKYYSGTAIYSKSFQLKRFDKNSKYELDLGDVQIIARVKINGEDAGVLWKPPFKQDVTQYLRKGDNIITIEITNLWPNRLIGDEHYPDDVSKDANWVKGELWSYPEWVWTEANRPEAGRVSFTTFKHWGKGDKLFPSGLKGPVTITQMITKEF